MRRHSTTRQGVPRRIALSNPQRPADKRGNGNPVKRKLTTYFENIRLGASDEKHKHVWERC
jgi:hypothetical protein